jgi:hypothetical protein
MCKLRESVIGIPTIVGRGICQFAMEAGWVI